MELLGKLSLPFLLGVMVLALGVLAVALAREETVSDLAARPRPSGLKRRRGLGEAAMILLGLGAAVSALAFGLKMLG